ncbi:MAG: RNA polymerase sigma factor [Rhodoglobus sp.]
MSASPDVTAALAAAHAGEWSRIVATLIRITGDWSLAEDAAQDAFELALTTWPRDGVPRNPGAWLTTTARNRAIDRIRRASSEAKKVREIGVMQELDEWADEYASDPSIEDDRLRLVFTCAHPALPLEARVALTLRTVAGLSTAEIARAFLVPEGTMAQRLVRAKHKIAAAGIPYRVPPPHLLKARLSGVLAVLYLLFNEGYAASSGDALVRHELANEAIRMTRALDALLPDEPEVAGLLALMLLQNSRRAARVDGAGTLVPLDEQDRALWDRAAIEEGTAILEAALRRGLPGVYQVQAAIAACHANASTPADVDHAEIVGLYDELRRYGDSPVLEFNRAIARGALHGPAVGLELVDALADDLAGYYLLPAAQADFLRRLGRTSEAAERYREALALAPTEPERRFLRRRIDEVG